MHRVAALRRLVFFLCAATFLFGGIAHAAHYGLDRGAAHEPTVSASADGQQGPSKSDRVITEVCHCCSLPALPMVAATALYAPIESAVPGGRAAAMQAHAAAIESPPPKAAT